jgi:N utilization substance protein B
MSARHNARILASQILYAWEINPTERDRVFDLEWLTEEERKNQNESTVSYAVLCSKGVLENLKTIDGVISEYSHNREIEKISKTDLAILRLGVYGLMFQKDTPYQVIIDESVTLCHEVGTGKAYKFINGLLDGVSKKNREP